MYPGGSLQASAPGQNLLRGPFLPALSSLPWFVLLWERLCQMWRILAFAVCLIVLLHQNLLVLSTVACCHLHESCIKVGLAPDMTEGHTRTQS